MPITLPQDLQSYVDESVARGEFKSQDDLIVNALADQRKRALARSRKREALIRDIQVGIDELERGESAPLDMDAIWREVATELGFDPNLVAR